MATNGESTGGGAVYGFAPIGFVSSTNGVVKATGTGCADRVINAGDPLFANDQLETGSAGSVTAELLNGLKLVLGANDIAVLDSDVIDADGLADIADATTSVEAIQEAILAGEDPTKLLERRRRNPGGGIRLNRGTVGSRAGTAFGRR